MATYEVSSFKELGTLLTKHAIAREKRIVKAVRAASRDAVSDIKQNVPVAFGELRESVHRHDTVSGAEVIVDAPYAAAVEFGSRPHTVPLDALVKWVKLRASQGLLTVHQQSRLSGSSTAIHARTVSAKLKGMESSGSLDVNAPIALARAIQLAIQKHGTKTHHSVQKSIPGIMKRIDILVHEAVRD